MDKNYKIDCYYIQDGMILTLDRAYALGELRDETYATREAAEEVADELRAGVGDVVDASTVYEVVECD